MEWGEPLRACSKVSIVALTSLTVLTTLPMLPNGLADAESGAASITQVTERSPASPLLIFIFTRVIIFNALNCPLCALVLTLSEEQRLRFSLRK